MDLKVPIVSFAAGSGYEIDHTLSVRGAGTTGAAAPAALCLRGHAGAAMLPFATITMSYTSF